MPSYPKPPSHPHTIVPQTTLIPSYHHTPNHPHTIIPSCHRTPNHVLIPSCHRTPNHPLTIIPLYHRTPNHVIIPYCSPFGATISSRRSLSVHSSYFENCPAQFQCTWPRHTCCVPQPKRDWIRGTKGLDPGYEGIRSGVRRDWIRGTRDWIRVRRD